MPRNVVAIGKCAGPLLDGVAEVLSIANAFAAIPSGYAPPRSAAEVCFGGHPQMTASSFEAGRRLLQFVESHDDILFLVSGGGSACVEVPMPPHTEEEVMRENATLVASSLPIEEINKRRAAMSGIKGGKLGARVRGSRVTLVHSDVSKGALAVVASGPTIVDGDEPLLIADNETLVRSAASLVGDKAIVIDEQIEDDVAEAARILASRARQLMHGEVLVAGGEPVVAIRGDGRGGRCSELALRFLVETRSEGFRALFAGSDGIDGNSGAAGIQIRPHDRIDPAAAEAALAVSNSFPIVSQAAEPIIIGATGNNLRDLFLVARD
jgi:hydroxypyruvate reductase